MSMSSRAVEQSADTTSERGKPRLSPRQRQILELLRAGKVNKEIARELGIGVGTVKQHLVVLFKRLNVRNRAMAVARAAELLGEDGPASVPSADEGMLIRRPCVALTVALGEGAGNDAERRFHRSMAGMAYDSNALFLQREGGVGALLFGIKRPSEHDVLVALHVAQCLVEELSEPDSQPAKRFKAALTAGLATINRGRYGNWSGDTVATPVLREAREVLEDCPLGEIRFSPAAAEVMRVFGLGHGQSPPAALGLGELGCVRRTSLLSEGDGPYIGREDEVAALSKRVRRRDSGLIVIEGETGMGKSRLCRHAAAVAAADSRATYAVRVVPGLFERPFWDLGDGSVLSLSELAGRLRETERHSLLVLDDIHLLAEQRRQTVFDLVEQLVEDGMQVILTGRRVKAPDTLSVSARLYLRRLGDGDTRSLVSSAADGLDEREVAALSADASGVPLFACELVQGERLGTPTLALLMTIAARLDGLKLDWRLLHALSADAAGATVAELAGRFGEPETVVMAAARHAIEAGVLCGDEKDAIAFRNPLIRKVIDYLGVD